MIKIIFNYDENRILKRFEFSGHAGREPAGENVTCAAVSALALTFSRSLVGLLKIKLSGEIKAGEIRLTLDEIAPEVRKDLSLLTSSLRLGLDSINEKYGNTIQIIENNNSGR